MVTGGARSGGGGCELSGGLLLHDLQPVRELHIQDQFWQLVVTIETAPAFLRALDQLEHHDQRGSGAWGDYASATRRARPASRP